VLWGLTYPLIRHAVLEINPVCFVAYRFSIAALGFAPFIFFNKQLRQEIKKAWPVGLAIGILASGFFVTQTIGLKTVPAPRAAFITATYVLTVPLLAPLFRSGNPTKLEWLSAVFAIFGLYLLINPAGGDSGLGDLLIFCCAIFVACHIHLIQKVGKFSYHPMALAFLQISGVALSGLFMVSLSPVRSVSISWGSWGAGAWASLLICGLIVTNGTFLLQAKFQKQTILRWALFDAYKQN
jgi:drug/metabolite transporter (DMT)-like permease